MGDAINETSEVSIRLPDLPKIMDKANAVIDIIAEDKCNQNTFDYQSLREDELKLELLRNKLLSGILVLVILILIVFK